MISTENHNSLFAFNEKTLEKFFVITESKNNFIFMYHSNFII